MPHRFDPAPHYAPRELPARLLLGAKLLALLGAACLAVGLVVDPVRTRIVFLVDLVYFMSLSMGGLVFAAAMNITLARWGRPFKRVAESFVLFMPVLWVLLLVFFLTGGLSLYEWSTHPEILGHGHKAAWLQPLFFTVRQLVLLGLLSLGGLLFLRNSLRPDLGVAAGILGDRSPAWWSWLTEAWRGDDAEIHACGRRNAVLGPVIVLLFAYVFSLVAFDLVMSLEPHWKADLFGWWFFTSAFWLGIAGTALLSMAWGRHLGISAAIGRSSWHDIGKLVFGFSMFWGYLLYSHLLPIWYGNMTEETGFVLVRTRLAPWTWVSRLVLALCFAIPFLTLLSRGLKKMAAGFAIPLVLIGAGLWLERFLLVAPSAWHQASMPVGVAGIGLTLGFAGGFAWVVGRFLSSVPALPVTDPLMQPHPDDVHAVSAGELPVS